MGPRLSVLQPLWPCNFKGFSHHVPQHTLLTPEPSTPIPDHPSYARMKMRKGAGGSEKERGRVICCGLLSEHQSGCPQILFPDGGEIGTPTYKHHPHTLPQQPPTSIS